MFAFIKRQNGRFLFSAVSRLLVFVLSFSLVFGPSAAQAQSIAGLNLPVPGAMVGPSAAFVPVLLKGMTIHPDNPLQFDFIIDSGNTNFTQDQIKDESQRLVKYFLASMTIPKDDLWVNLSPYEKDRIIPDELGKTELGRDMLAQDYILKQLTASLMYPEKELGKAFWDKVYKQAKEKFGTTEIPVDTFNKVWILPETATVYEHGQTVYIVDAKLRVMLDSDYVAMNQGAGGRGQGTEKLNPEPGTQNPEASAEIIREIILPEIEREINEGQNFAPLRQIYHSLILAKWYKETIKNSLLSKIYVDKKFINGIRLEDGQLKGEDGSIIDSQSSIVDQIYNQYMEAYKKGVFNYIKEDYDRLSKEYIPRKYFSGGEKLTQIPLTRAKSSSPIKGNGFLGTGVVLAVALVAAAGIPLLIKDVLEQRVPGGEIIKENISAWEKAVESGKIKEMDALLKQGVNVNTKLKKGVTALHSAAYKGRYDVVNFLIENGADVGAKTDNGYTALMAASGNGHVSVVEVLWDRMREKLELNTQTENGATALILAAESGYADVVDYLLQIGADVGAKTSTDSTPLTIAAQNGHTKVVMVLLKNGAKISARTSQGFTAFMIAAQNGHLETVKALWENKTEDLELNAQAENGVTALMMAAYTGREAIVDYLLKIGADSQMKDNEYGRTALDWARIGEHQKTIDLLDKSLLRKKGGPGNAIMVSLLPDQSSSPVITREVQGAADKLINQLSKKRMAPEQIISWLENYPERTKRNFNFSTQLAFDRKMFASVVYEEFRNLLKAMEQSVIIRRQAYFDKEQLQLGLDAARKQELRAVVDYLKGKTDQQNQSSAARESSSPVAEREASTVKREAQQNTRDASRDTSDEVGGIDMNVIDLDKQGGGVDIQFDPAQLQELIDLGIDGFAPVIINITPLPSVLPLLGLDPAAKEEKLEVSSLN